MSKDIRSFFNVVSKKSGSDPSSSTKPKPKKVKNIIDSDDEIIEETPPKSKTKKENGHKKRHVILSSDSEEDKRDKSKKKEKTPSKKLKTDSKESKLKPVNIDDLFRNTTVKQSKVDYVPPKESEKTKTNDKNKNDKCSKKEKKKNPELGIHNDEAFDKTLIELDEDDDTILLENMDLLDKTMEEAEKLIQLEEQKEKEKKLEKENHETPKKEDKKRQRRESLESKTTPSTKKQKLEHVDSGIDQDQERYEKKRHSAALYQRYLNRGGPKHRGEKEIPKGKPDCLKNLTFLKTGVLDSLESEEFENLITSHGGRVVHGVSKKVNYIVVGDDPGPSKLEKARNYNIPEVDENELLDMILIKSGMKPKYSGQVQSEDLGIGSEESIHEQSSISEKNKEKVKKEKESPKNQKSKSPKENGEGSKPNLKKLGTEKVKKEHTVEEKSAKPKEIKSEKTSPHKNEDNVHSTEPEIRKIKAEKPLPEKEEVKKEKFSPYKNEKLTEKLSDTNTDSLQCWTERYRPSNLKAIIGQQESNSNMNKLRNWLKNWDHNQKPDVKKKLPRPTPWNQFDGAYFKAALLSGSPGVGKTTTATLVAQDLGFDIIEFNASDTRSKKLLHEEISHMMNQKSVSAFAQGHANLNQKRVLLMDEVDGMAGNEDRGGIGELINLIKISNFPIICMCNDRNHQKMRTLVTHCFGLKFNKPPLNQIRGAMMSICFKEGLKIKPEALAELINGTGCDIRQTLNNLAMWSAVDKNLTDSTVKKEAAKAHKDVVFGPWDVVRKVFTYSENKDMSIQDKARLFFYDYSLGPLFVQENYLKFVPNCKNKESKQSIKKETIVRLCKTAESLSIGDQIEAKIRRTNNWSLLDSQSYFSTVIPSYYMSGEVAKGKGIDFPGWFGKNSKQTKTKRLISELHSHMRTSASGDKISVRMDYCLPLRNAIVSPLKKDGVNGIRQALDVMKSYCLLREDLNNLVDLCHSFKNKDIFNDVESKVKAAFTRAYNKEVLLPFAPPAANKKKKSAENEFGEEDNEEQDDEEQEDDSLENDGMIKIKPSKQSKAGSSKDTKSSKVSTSKTSAKGKGKK